MERYRNKCGLLWAICLFSLCLAGCTSMRGQRLNTQLQEEPETSIGQDLGTEALENSAEGDLATEALEDFTKQDLATETMELSVVLNKTEEALVQEKAAEYLNKMTIEEKAAQLFIVLPESFMEGVGSVTAAGTATQEAFDQIPVGGFIYMEPNLQSSEQVKEMLANVQRFSMERIGLPAFLCVDEEGGSVARIAGTGKFDVPVVEEMAEIGRRQDVKEAYNAGVTIGGYLFALGFNVDFAPVADVWTNPENQVVKKRAFGSDARIVSDLANAAAEGLKSQGMLACLKHFPGHGNTSADTHAGYAFTDKTKEELLDCELLPFVEGIEADVPFIMAGHISLPNVIGDDTPASLSSVIMEDLLRKEMGYGGIIITDAFNMGAIAGEYSSAEAAVKALQAGADMILMPKDFKDAYNGVVSAVKDGGLSVERIDESLMRILMQKINIIETKQ